MKPAGFIYERPKTVDDAVELLARHGAAAKLLAGGQSLIPLMNLRLVFTDFVVDLNRLPELQYVSREGDAILIGAMTRQRALEHSERIVADLPLLAEALGHVAHWQIRNRGTIGGSLAHADPAAELAAVLLALDGELTVRGPRGSRTIGADALYRTYFTTTLEPDELVTEVRLPVQGEGAGWSFREIARRHGDFALVLVAVFVEVAAGRIATARVALGGVADRPVRAHELEASVVGTSGDAASIAAAVATLESELSAPDDLHASGEYRRKAVGILTSQALLEAVGRAMPR